MKTIVALVLLAALGFAAAGCASAKKAVTKKGGSVSIDILTTPESRSNEIGVSFGKGYTINSGVGGVTIVVTRSATIPHVKPGTLVRCKGGPSDRVPRGSVVETSSSSGSSKSLELSHSLRVKGTVTVTCRK